MGANEKKPQELFRMITNSVNSRSVRSSNQENQLNLNKGKRLFTTDEEVKDLIENFSSEYEGIICEKEHLHDVSNNLKNDLQQAKKSLKTKKGLPIVQKKSDKKLLDDFKINNFAKDLLNNASNGGQEGFTKISGRATDRMTESQRNLQLRMQKKQDNSTKKQEPTKIRNWNLKDDIV